MRRGELYFARSRSADPRPRRVYLVVSRQELIDSRYSSLICVPVYSGRVGLDTEVSVGVEEGMKHESALRCDEVTSIDRGRLGPFVGSLSPAKMNDVNRALTVALALDVPV